MARDPELEAILAADLAHLTGVEAKKMFGGQCFMWRGNLLCGADHTGILFRTARAAMIGRWTKGWWSRW